MFIGVVCNEARMLQVADRFAKEDRVSYIKNKKDLLDCKRKLDVLILPIKSLSDCDFTLADMKGLKSDVFIFSGLYDALLKEMFSNTCFYMEEEQVISQNAILTAEGVLNAIIECCPRSIYDIGVDVIGYGHCGKAIYEMLTNLQMKVRVIRRNCVEDHEFIPLSAWHEPLDLVVHTATGSVLDAKRMKTWHTRPIILDISTAQLIDLDYANDAGIKVKKIANLPAKYASISAGNIIYHFIRGKLCEK